MKKIHLIILLLSILYIGCFQSESDKEILGNDNSETDTGGSDGEDAGGSIDNSEENEDDDSGNGFEINDFDPTEFAYNAGIVSLLLTGCTVMGESEDKVFALDEEGDIRGVSESSTIPIGFSYEGVSFDIQVYSNESSGEIISFKYYNNEYDKLIDLNELFIFESGYSANNLESPFLLSIKDVENSHSITNCDTGVTQSMTFQLDITSINNGDIIFLYDNIGVLNDDCDDLQYGPIALDSFIWGDESQINCIGSTCSIPRTLIGSLGSCNFGSMTSPGFQSGNSVIIKVFNSNLNQLNDFCMVLDLGNGEFGNPLIVVSNILPSETSDLNNDGICD